MTSRFIRKLGVICLSVAALGLVAVAPANAAVASGSVAAAPAICHDTTYGGNYICAYSKHTFTFSNGTKEIWVIGPDYAVWTRWKTASGSMPAWVSQQGQIRHSLSASDFTVITCGTQPVIFVVGTDNNWYNKGRRSNGTWSEWRLGGSIACPA